MEEIIYDVWDAGGSNIYFYTQLKLVSDMLKQDFNRFAIYILRGRIVAWQFLIPKRLEKVLLRRIAGLLENETNNDNDLQG